MSRSVSSGTAARIASVSCPNHSAACGPTHTAPTRTSWRSVPGTERAAWEERAHEAGFPGWASDDLADGYESPEEAVDGWATSDGHAHQMRGDFKMNGQWRNYKFNRIGVGISGRKYIAVFGRSDEKL